MASPLRQPISAVSARVDAIVGQFRMPFDHRQGPPRSRGSIGTVVILSDQSVRQAAETPVQRRYHPTPVQPICVQPVTSPLPGMNVDPISEP